MLKSCRGWGLGALLSVTTLPAQAATLHSSLSLIGERFATDSTPAPKVEVRTDLLSESRLYETQDGGKGVASRELHFYSFFETTKGGEKSLDLDDTVARIGFGGLERFFAGHFWIGRTHPENEGHRDSKILTTSAIGANWAQNQAYPLDPRVMGWIGAGIHLKNPVTGVFLTLAGSPIAIPNMGPTVDFSETAETTGGRFAHLPPQSVILNGVEFPLRYRLNIGNLKDIVLQKQYFVAVGYEDRATRAHLMTWSAPTPNPKVDVAGILRIVNERDGEVRVTATPRFPRETFFGARWSLVELFPKPTLETVYERNSGRVTVSARLHPWEFIDGGWTHTLLSQQPAESEPSGPTIVSPTYAKALAWGEVNTASLFNRVRASIRLERHLAEREQGQWIRPSIEYQPIDNLAVFATLNVMTGENGSYFGAWRSLDSFATGVRAIW